MDIKKAFIIYKNQGPDVLVNILVNKGLKFKDINSIMQKMKKLDVIYEQVKYELDSIEER